MNRTIFAQGLFAPVAKRIFLRLITVFMVAISVVLPAYAQSPDYGYVPVIGNPEAKPVPIVMFDRSHNNFHNVERSYSAFRDILTADGYNVREISGTFDDSIVNGFTPFQVVRRQPTTSASKLALTSNILVIASACPAPCGATDQAFSAAEVNVIRDWVGQGGSLFLIFDHPPFSQVQNLVYAFGVNMATEGGVVSNDESAFNFDTTTQLDGTLAASSAIVSGRVPAETVGHVRTFYGSGFFIVPPSPATSYPIAYEPIMTFGKNATVVSTWPVKSAAGMFQGLAIRFGAGRVYVSGEAAMFTAQFSNPPATFGVQIPEAAYNTQFLRNIIHWLDGRMAAIAGRVTLSDGSGLSTVTITVATADNKVYTTTTDSNGWYISPREIIRGGAYYVQAYKKDYKLTPLGRYVTLGDQPETVNFAANRR